jgi:RNA recognition motif-containing protein
MEEKVFVGNLPFSCSAEELSDLLSEVGPVSDVHLVTDRETGRPRGFAFVTFESADAAREAIEKFDGQDFGGRPLRINEARPREDRGGGGGGGGGGGFRGAPRGGGGGGGRGGYERRGGGGGGGPRGGFDRRGGGGGGRDRRGGGGRGDSY